MKPRNPAETLAALAVARRDRADLIRALRMMLDEFSGYRDESVSEDWRIPTAIGHALKLLKRLEGKR
jgi:hypothetical protein